MSETEPFNIYSIYIKTFVAILVSGIVLLAGIGFFVYTTKPVRGVSPSGVTEVGHAAAGTQTETAAGDAAGQTGVTQTAAAARGDSFALYLNGSSSDSDYLWIPVQDGLGSDAITIENHYMDRQLWVAISGGDPGYYRDEYISGNLEGVSYAEAYPDTDRLILKFDMDHVYEYNTIFEDGVLYINKMKPREVYDRIVVIDPAGSIPDEYLKNDSLTPARICQDISSKLMASLEDSGIRVYVTSLDERIAATEDSVALLTEVRPDMYIRIETSYNEDSAVYGTETVYNGTYFIPGFGSVELADLLEANVTTSIGGKASGLVEAGENDEVIRRATVPAASIRVGYYTNMQENILLNRDDYRTRIAEGIETAVMTVYGDEDE